jgi:hypothetical protein
VGKNVEGATGSGRYKSTGSQGWHTATGEFKYSKHCCKHSCVSGSGPFLTPGIQNVNIQGEKSGSCDVDSGVPQGTVLGPILFTVYIDDLEVEVTRRLLEVLILKFADDTKGAKVIENAGDRDKLQEALDCLCNWAEKWGMEFNVAKCKVMHVGRNNPEYRKRG